MISNYRSAIVKWNGGRGALLCNRCRTIIAEGIRHPDVEHFCDDCSRGHTPLAYMLKGGPTAMRTIRRLLDARRGGV